MTKLAECYTIAPSNDSTLAIEVFKTGLMRRKKHIVFFENFTGELWFASENPELSRVTLAVDAQSAACRDAWLSQRKQESVTEFARKEALSAGVHQWIRFTSTRIYPKKLRGFVIEGVLNICGTTRVVKVNAVLGATKRDRFQIDGDAILRLSDFEVPRPSGVFGLTGTKDEALVRLLLWATPRSDKT